MSMKYKFKKLDRKSGVSNKVWDSITVYKFTAWIILKGSFWVFDLQPLCGYWTLSRNSQAKRNMMFMQYLLMSIFFQCHWLDSFVWFSFHQLIWFHNQYRNVNTPFLVQFNSHLLNIAHIIQSARIWSIRSHHYMYILLFLKQITNEDLLYSAENLCSIVCNGLNGKIIWKIIDTSVCITESLCSTLEPNIILLVDYKI